MNETPSIRNDEELGGAGSVRVVNNTTISFNAPVEDSSVDDFIQMLAIVSNQLRKTRIDYPGYTPRVRLFFSTQGGDVYEAFRMYDAIRNSEVPVDIYASGVVASSGLFILLAAATKYAYPHTSFLYHQISGGMRGTQQQLQGWFKHTEDLSKYLQRIIADNTKMTMDQLSQIHHEEHWFDSLVAVEYGFVDEIVHKPII